MSSLLSIFHNDLLPPDAAAEYELGGTYGGNHSMLLYRRGMSPDRCVVTERDRLRIPLVPLTTAGNYKTSAELKTEVKSFINECISDLPTRETTMTKGIGDAAEFIAKRGGYIYHVLYTLDLYEKLSPVFNYISERKCMAISGRKKTVVVLPEPGGVGWMSIKEDSVGTRFGMMLFKNNAFCFTVSD